MLDQADHRRLIEDAVRELDFSALEGEPQLVAVVSRTYAQALFDSAKEQGRLDEVREELQHFVPALHEVPELGALLRNPQLDPRAKAEALAAVMEGADQLVRNFFALVAEKGRAGQIQRDRPRVRARSSPRRSRSLEVELTTAFELSDEEARRSWADRAGLRPPGRRHAHASTPT